MAGLCRRRNGRVLQAAMIRAALPVALLLAAAACSQSSAVPMSVPTMDAIGKEFAAPPRGMAAVYFYDPQTASPRLNVTVTASGRVVGRLDTQTWMRAEFGPGEHTFWCHGGNSNDGLMMRLAPGEIRYVDVQLLPDQWWFCRIRETDPDSGRAGVINGSRAAQH